MNSGNQYQVKHVMGGFSSSVRLLAAGQKCFSWCEQMFGLTQGVDTLNSSPVADVCASHGRGCEGELYSKDLGDMPGRYPSQLGFRIGTQVALFSKSLRKE